MKPWTDIRRIQSTDENVCKYVFAKDDAVAEAVLYKYPTYERRTVMCVSTQSGCPVGCRFCGAGDSFVRSLTTDEIVAQPTHLFDDKGIDPSEIERLQIMFMSMGEPLLNLPNLVPALRVLHEQFPNAALLISTSAPRVDYGPLRAISEAIPAIGLQFSVHESTDEARDRLVPFAAKLSLAEMAAEGRAWHAATGRQPFFNYCAHEKNTSWRDANRLLSLFDPEVWQATISVVCERDESVAAANDRQRDLAADFQSLLRERGYSTRMFDPAGQDDIGGGCGQLWYVQKWMRDNPDKARPSVGRKLPVLHAPRVFQRSEA
ncbi:MAG: radical SAM protein [Kofleriaceae bacterium]